ncbi:A/G-specific adenine glycosylase [Candidatus Rariloculus sp.]|uniref:A/G-specific adenine glycosylase n=1 Tax=Candidatus Rariloculus sp. TaxID=3101265 RepID=UPI003D0E3519
MGSFARKLLDWHAAHGRHDLPWQARPTPYGIWVSEIMLQQTQVATVVPYYQRFMQRFPTLAALAAAPLDEVLSLWAGLGYYARGRNLHRSARIVVERWEGRLPATLDGLLALPGIGRSTAGAILAQAYGRRFAILDGNVKRVLARYHAVEGWPGETAVERVLWEHAERHTPREHVAAYTQAIMDLGATVCTRRRPACKSCPVVRGCAARRAGIETRLPAPRPRRTRPRRTVAALIIIDPERRVLLERRPEQGIWGGLYSFPELPEGEQAEQWCARKLGSRVRTVEVRDPVTHALTHFDLELAPIQVRLASYPKTVMEGRDRIWHDPAAPPTVGVAAPIVTLLRRLNDERERRIA